MSTMTDFQIYFEKLEKQRSLKRENFLDNIILSIIILHRGKIYALKRCIIIKLLQY